MAENETTTTAPVVAENAPVEHALNTVDPQPLLEVLDGLAEDEPAPVAEEQAPQTAGRKPGEIFEPMGNVSNHP
ncbi:hypothetical protein AB0K43_24400 [Kitasatospora sp. NPDC049258]|uniref:hypothetical protein n=1 Tax=Kitasatospora sp. NPDC049258 TaxID=3155394 RepID=UPI003437241E